MAIFFDQNELPRRVLKSSGSEEFKTHLTCSNWRKNAWDICCWSWPPLCQRNLYIVKWYTGLDGFWSILLDFKSGKVKKTCPIHNATHSHTFGTIILQKTYWIFLKGNFFWDILYYFVLQADRATFTSRMTTMVSDIAADFVGLSLHCFSDGNQSLERVLQERWQNVINIKYKMYKCLYYRLTAWTEDVGGMIRQWTLSSALTHLRTFVSGLTSDQASRDRIQSWLVTTEQGQLRRQ